MRHRCHHRVHHGGVREQQIFDFLRIDVLAATTEHVVDAAAEVKEALLVLAENVARAQPAVLELLPRNLRLVVIAQAHIGASDQQFAFIGLAAGVVDQSNFDLRRRHTRAAAGNGPAVDRRTQGTAALGQAVALRYLHVRQRPLDRIEKLGRDHRGADAHAAQSAEIERIEILAMLQKHREHGGNPARIGALVLGQGFQVGARLIGGHEHEGAAGVEHGFDRAA